MPRAIDPRDDPNASHDPTVSGTQMDFQRYITDQGEAITKAIQYAIDQAIAEFLDFIKDQTGIDFSGIAEFFDSLLSGLDNILGFSFHDLADLNPIELLNNFVAAFQGIDFTNPGSILNAIAQALEGVPILGDFVQALTGVIDGDYTDLTAWAERVPLLNLITGFLNGGVIPGLDASKITSGAFSIAMVTGLLDWLKSLLPWDLFSNKAADGPNMAVNANFEVPNIWNETANPFWTGYGQRSSERAHTGSWSWKMVGDAGGQKVFGLAADPTIPADQYPIMYKVRPGQKFKVEVWVYPKSTNVGGYNIGLWNLASSNGVLDYPIGAIGPAPTKGQWTKLTIDVAMPAGVDRWVPYFVVDAQPGTEVYYVDDIFIQEVTQSQNIIETLFGSGFLGSNILASVIPGLDASKVTSGQFAQSQVNITNIAASIVNGALALANIPPLPASQTTTGTFGAGLIPSLDASKITTGTFAPAITGLENAFNSIVNGILGTTSTGQTQAAATSALASLNGRVTALEGAGVLTTYTSNATWTRPTSSPWTGVAYKPTDLFTIICVCGGQGGGKSGNTSAVQARGGQSGGYIARQVPYSDLPASVSMTIGAAGAGASSEGAGSLGGQTSFGSVVVGARGLGGVFKDDGSYAASTPPGNGGAGAFRTNGFAGEYGQSAAFATGGNPGVTGTGGNGGSSPENVPSGGGGGGGGGASGTSGSVGGTGGFPGGGGGAGGALSGSNNANGSAGGAGCIYVVSPY